MAHLQQLWETDSPGDEETLLLDTPSDSPELLVAFRPLVAWGSRLLRQRLERLRTTFQDLPFDPATVHHLFLINLLPQLQQATERTLVLEMHIARLEERLTGDTPQERLRTFFQQYRDPSHWYAFLSMYPLLARTVVTLVHQWADSSLEIAQHLCADWREIGRVFAHESDLGHLVEVRTGAGDTHRRGRSVAILRFSSGFQLVYKPRSLTLDRHFQEVLSWINALGITQALRTLTILDAGNHGWVEFVQVQPCSTEAEVRHFYERQGSYLALLYTLEATDFHEENVLAAGEHPVLVDLETLLHARLGEDDLHRTRPEGYSVLRTGLLPGRFQLEKGGAGRDISGLGGHAGQMSPQPVPTWKERGTDQVRLAREHREFPASQNRPRLQGHDVETTRYTTEILKGFMETYRVLMAHQQEWLTAILPRFERDEVRVILRPTGNYTPLLSDSLRPEHLRDAFERERLFDYLWGGVSSQPYLRRVMAAEQADLMHGDVPIFTAHAGSRDLITSQGERIRDFLAVSGMEAVKERITVMDEKDLALQQWIIQASLATTLMQDEHASRVPLPPFPSPVSPQQLLQVASAVGMRLDALAIRGKRGANWLGVQVFTQSEGGTIWQLQASGSSLYSGLPGIILFLSYLGKLTGEQRHLDLADLALSSLEKMIKQEKALQVSQLVGAFSGRGSLLYLYSHLSVLRGESAFLQRAHELVEEIDSLIEQDTQFDIIGGAAGCLICLLGLSHLAPSPRTLEVAIRCGEHLLANAHELAGGLGWYTMEPGVAPTGFAHGAAGIALSLFQLAEASQQDRFRQTALAALAYERSLFSPEQENWSHVTSQGAQGFPIVWCYGASGIGLARLACLPYYDDEQIRREIQVALATTLKYGFGGNHCLCHGDLGNLETLLTATQVLDHAEYREALQRLTAQVFQGIQEHGWVTDVPLAVETPGLMTGLAGIGYQLLRLAAPESVPSVLVLAPPLGDRNRSH